MKNADLIFNFKVHGQDKTKVVPVLYRDFKDLTKKIKSYKENGIIHTSITGNPYGSQAFASSVHGIYISGDDILEIGIDFLRNESEVENLAGEEVEL